MTNLSLLGPSINVSISWVYKSYTFWDPSPQKEFTSTFFECQNSQENNKNQAKKLKVYRKNGDFHRPPPLKCMLHSWKYWHWWTFSVSWAKTFYFFFAGHERLRWVAVSLEWQEWRKSHPHLFLRVLHVHHQLKIFLHSHQMNFILKFHSQDYIKRNNRILIWFSTPLP